MGRLVAARECKCPAFINRNGDASERRLQIEVGFKLIRDMIEVGAIVKDSQQFLKGDPDRQFDIGCGIAGKFDNFPFFPCVSGKADTNRL